MLMAFIVFEQASLTNRWSDLQGISLEGRKILDAYLKTY